MEAPDLVIYKGEVHFPAPNGAETLCGISHQEIVSARRYPPRHLAPKHPPICEKCQWGKALLALAGEGGRRMVVGVLTGITAE